MPRAHDRPGQINLWPDPDKPLAKQVRKAIKAATTAAREQATNTDWSHLDKQRR